jgi:hypothetical protein
MPDGHSVGLPVGHGLSHDDEAFSKLVPHMKESVLLHGVYA